MITKLKTHAGNIFFAIMLVFVSFMAFNARGVQAEELTQEHIDRCITLMRRVPELVEQRERGYSFRAVRNYARDEWPEEYDVMQIIVLAVFDNYTHSEYALRKWTAITCQEHGHDW